MPHSSSEKHSSVPTNGTKKRPGGSSHHHGSGGSAHPSVPPGVDPEIWESFLSVDTDRSQTITAIELQTALKKGNWPTFEIDTVKLLMTLFDTDRNGTIDINEFDGLWKYIKSWEEAFRHYDKNKNNAIDGDELEEALERFGYPLTPQLQGLLKRKYDVPWPSKEGEAGKDPAADGHNAPPGITFDRFMRACVVVKQLKELFDAFDKDPNGQVKINYETFLEMVFKLP